tara:strand:+ start:1089 stop:2069 length:981 start_codon:yes stop_codon:yes gene_type:complete
MHQYDLTIEIETTGICNAECPSCTRFDFLPDKLEMFHKKHILPKTILDVDAFTNNLCNIINKDSVQINFEGSFSDPLTHPRILELVKSACSIENAGVSVKTNGSLRNKKLYIELAKHLNTRHRQMFFSIDGLGERNAIYRRKTNWDKIMSNAQAFIEASGIATWKAVHFEQHEKDYDEMKKLSTSMGFESFLVHSNRADKFQQDQIFKLGKEYSPTKINNDVSRDYKEFHQYKTVICRHLDNNYYFIGCDSKVYACCELWGDMIDSKPSIRRLASKVTYSNSNDISLKEHKFYDIIKNDKFKKLDNSIRNKPNLLCKKNCRDYVNV